MSSDLLKNINEYGGAITITISIGLNIFLLIRGFCKSLLYKQYFAGHWQGHLIGNKVTLKCILILYFENGNLSGQLYYDGKSNNDNVRGFDSLDNLAQHFKPMPIYIPLLHHTISWFPLKNKFEVTFRSLIHCTGENSFTTEHLRYDYCFTILRRFTHPRVTCQTTLAGVGDQRISLTGEFAKLTGTAR
jgi:hypothetical protein